MSISEQPVAGSPETVRLSVSSPDPFLEIFVIDGDFRRVGSGVGALETDLPPGLYKLKFKAGDTIEEQLVVLRPTNSVVAVSAPIVLFPSAAPLEGTSTSHEYHRYPAIDMSRKVHVPLGKGSEVFVFVRDLLTSKEPQPDASPGNPIEGLSLRGADGRSLVDLPAASERSGSEDEPCAGCTVALDPGRYLLRVNTGYRGAIEQTIVASPGWQTQVFLTRRPFGRDRIMRPDLSSAAILMARLGMGFVADIGSGGDSMWSNSLRWTEFAREALVNGRSVVSQLNEMLWEKYENPMLGILGGHILVASLEAERRAKPEPPDFARRRDHVRAVLDEVVHNLNRLLQRDYEPPVYHPDVDALAIWLHGPSGLVFDTPPMLQSSWRILVEASGRQQNIIPKGSLAARISDDLVAAGPWLVWNRPDSWAAETVAPEEQAGRPTLDMSRLRAMVPQIAQSGDDEDGPAITLPPAKEPLTAVERGLYQYLSLAAQQQNPALGFRKTATSDEDLKKTISAPALVDALGVPVARIEEAAEGLARKMEWS